MELSRKNISQGKSTGLAKTRRGLQGSCLNTLLERQTKGGLLKQVSFTNSCRLKRDTVKRLIKQLASGRIWPPWGNPQAGGLLSVFGKPCLTGITKSFNNDRFSCVLYRFRSSTPGQEGAVLESEGRGGSLTWSRQRCFQLDCFWVGSHPIISCLKP